MILIGYTCVESAEEDIAPRLKDLRAADCTEIIHEVATLRNSLRPKLSQTISRLVPGDTLIVSDLACVAWSLPQLLTLLTALRDRGVTFRALQSQIDTSGSNSGVILNTLRAVLSFSDSLKGRTPVVRATKRIQVMEVIARLKARQPGIKIAQIAAELKRLGYKPPHGGTEWSRTSVKSLLARAKLTGILIEK